MTSLPLPQPRQMGRSLRQLAALAALAPPQGAGSAYGAQLGVFPGAVTHREGPAAHTDLPVTRFKDPFGNRRAIAQIVMSAGAAGGIAVAPVADTDLGADCAKTPPGRSTQAAVIPDMLDTLYRIAALLSACACASRLRGKPMRQAIATPFLSPEPPPAL